MGVARSSSAGGEILPARAPQPWEEDRPSWPNGGGDTRATVGGAGAIETVSTQPPPDRQICPRNRGSEAGIASNRLTEDDGEYPSRTCTNRPSSSRSGVGASHPSRLLSACTSPHGVMQGWGEGWGRGTSMRRDRS